MIQYFIEQNGYINIGGTDCLETKFRVMGGNLWSFLQVWNIRTGDSKPSKVIILEAGNLDEARQKLEQCQKQKFIINEKWKLIEPNYNPMDLDWWWIDEPLIDCLNKRVVSGQDVAREKIRKSTLIALNVSEKITRV